MEATNGEANDVCKGLGRCERKAFEAQEAAKTYSG